MIDPIGGLSGNLPAYNKEIRLGRPGELYVIKVGLGLTGR